MNYEFSRQVNLQSIPQQIEQFGWTMAYTYGDGSKPDYAYSIGFFETLQCPEILIYGINRGKCFGTFEYIFELLSKTKEKFPSFEKNYDILEDDIPVVFADIEFSKAYEYFYYCNCFYEDKTVIYPAMQLIWPDGKGLFPWEANFNLKYKRQQPLICNFKLKNNKSLQ